MCRIDRRAETRISRTERNPGTFRHENENGSATFQGNHHIVSWCGRSALAALLASFSIAIHAQPQASKPNFVFILMDNLGYGEPGIYGGGVTRVAPTPRIDQLANEGMRLTNFNVEAQCTPSRSAIMTGRFSIRSGTHSVPIGEGLDGLTQWEVTIAEALSSAGYATGHFGKWHLGSVPGRLPNDQGFDEWYGIPRTTDEAFWPSEPAAKAAGVAANLPCMISTNAGSSTRSVPGGRSIS